jgi:hypothetical protein
MNVRGSQIYIARETRRLLSVIARSEGAESSADSVGDRLLSETLTSRYPGLVSLQKEIDVIEEKMVETAKRHE